MSRVPVNDAIVARARELLERPAHKGWQDKGRLRQIISGRHKTIDINWWREENGVTETQLSAKVEKDFAKKLAALEAMADPGRNPNGHERMVAEAALAKLQTAGPPKAQMRSPPGLEEYDREIARARAAHTAHLDAAFRAAKVRWDAEQAAQAHKPTAKPKPTPAKTPLNTTTTKPQSKPEPKPEPTTTKKPRSADRHLDPSRDRHLEPNKDRHRPEYMRTYLREYMRRRRAAQRG
jgi:hypothetical protein